VTSWLSAVVPKLQGNLDTLIAAFTRVPQTRW